MSKYLTNVVTFLTHLVPAALVAIGHHLVADAKLWIQIVLLLTVVGCLFVVYKWLISYGTKREQDPLRAEIEELKSERGKLRRYNHLRKSMLDGVGDFVRERYRANNTLTLELTTLIESQNMSIDSVKASLLQADATRREKVSETLGRLSELLKDDTFRRPRSADDDNKDRMSVSVYEVSKDGDEKFLVPTHRHFPGRSKPQTPRFKLGEGAAGKAWRDEKIYICELGGDDPEFREMREGQKKEYASMICVPVIADYIKEKSREVIGILTIHSTERKGYFENAAREFWLDFLQPICDILVYSSKSKEQFKAISDAFESTVAKPEIVN